MTNEPTATALVAAIAVQQLSATAAIDQCLETVARLEPRLRAWAHLDPAQARAQARALDQVGGKTGRLHGVPVGVKDIYDTADFPTENGSVIDAGRRPARDAWVVARLRAEGAVIPGKTVTTEYACFAPGPTRNPHDPERTPGGSSSGSAAAVAAGMVPVALGSQTNGSVIRPASFCGVYGMKPSYGLIPRTGCLTTSRTLDHVGFFARTLDDLALLGEVLAGHDPADPATRPGPAVDWQGPLARELAAAPRLAFVGGPTWGKAEPSTQAEFTGLANRLGVQRVELPDIFADAIAVHRTIWTTELAFHLRSRWEQAIDRVSPQLRQLLDEGRATSALDYQEALARRENYRERLAALLGDYDAILTPAAPGEAPPGIEATGSPVFCSLWTLVGLPALSLPLLKGPAGLPLGCQLVGAAGADAGLLRTARWLERAAGGGSAGPAPPDLR